MANLPIPSASDVQQAASGIVTQGKELLGKAKKIGGVLTGANAAQEDLRATQRILNDPNKSVAEKAAAVAALVRDRLPVPPPLTTLPASDADEVGQGAPPAEDAPPVAPFLIPQFKDP